MRGSRLAAVAPVRRVKDSRYGAVVETSTVEETDARHGVAAVGTSKERRCGRSSNGS